ncbi:hypothetical protein GS682_18885 [Nostoc sp. B(2019)]|nr:hypothetical protein [Nostoc sp. B(2019)]
MREIILLFYLLGDRLQWGVANGFWSGLSNYTNSCLHWEKQCYYGLRLRTY